MGSPYDAGSPSPLGDAGDLRRSPPHPAEGQRAPSRSVLCSRLGCPALGSGRSAWGSGRTSLFTRPRWLPLALAPLAGKRGAGRNRTGGEGGSGELGDGKAARAAALYQDLGCTYPAQPGTGTELLREDGSVVRPSCTFSDPQRPNPSGAPAEVTCSQDTRARVRALVRPSVFSSLG